MEYEEALKKANERKWPVKGEEKGWDTLLSASHPMGNPCIIKPSIITQPKPSVLTNYTAMEVWA